MSIELQSKSTLVIYATVRAIRFMRFFFFQSLRLLHGTAFTVTRVNSVLTLRVCELIAGVELLYCLAI